MNTQTPMRLALATFVFGLAASLGANAGIDVCKRCELNYESCLASGLGEAECWPSYLACLNYGDGQHPCPMPR